MICIGNVEFKTAKSAGYSGNAGYGKDHLQLTVVKGYLVKLLGNARIVRHLMQHRPEFLAEFQAITEMASTPPPEAE
ncbi:ParB family protein [alpha proteobacterium BAL199]|nr:ParB family protein [alpha proteobacterium BAL199]